jgi:hypothetical protein
MASAVSSPHANAPVRRGRSIRGDHAAPGAAILADAMLEFLSILRNMRVAPFSLDEDRA